MHVLLVNRDSDILSVLKDNLEEHGHVVDTCHEPGSDAHFVALVHGLDPDVIVWDICPPYRENWERFLRMRACDHMRHWPFICMTTSQTMLEEIDREVDVAMSMPLKLDDLLHAIDTACS